tara:strand:+ start:955 stop:1131 length:177 start_codon:yes stop_codon:yes gene_type:complete
MERDVPRPSAGKRMPAPDSRLIDQLWDVHWSIVLQHLQCKRTEPQQGQKSDTSGDGSE